MISRLFTSNASCSKHLALYDFCQNQVVKVSTEFSLTVWDVLPTRKADAQCTLPSVITFFVIPQLVSCDTPGRVALIRKGQLSLFCWFARLRIVLLFVPSIAFAAPAVPIFLQLPCTCAGWRQWLILSPSLVVLPPETASLSWHHFFFTSFAAKSEAPILVLLISTLPCVLSGLVPFAACDCSASSDNFSHWAVPLTANRRSCCLVLPRAMPSTTLC